MKRFFKHFLYYDLIPLLSMLAVCAFPCVFLYARNASEVPADSMIPFLVVFSLNALLFFGISAIFLKNVSRAAFFSDLAMLVVAADEGFMPQTVPADSSFGITAWSVCAADSKKAGSAHRLSAGADCLWLHDSDQYRSGDSRYSLQPRGAEGNDARRPRRS